MDKDEFEKYYESPEANENSKSDTIAVSYTHLTLPTRLSV